ncbi:MAG: beta-propeller domain-containing protein [Myxococcaceae bacterium]
MRPFSPSQPLLLLAALSSLAACSSSPSNSLNNPPGIAHQVTLTNFTNCNALDQAIVNTEVLQMQAQLQMVQQGYFYPGGLLSGGPVPATAGNANGPSAYTTTTAQVAGVDEADFVQNDGTRIFVLSGATLYAASSWPPQALSLQGQLPIEGWPQEMFLDGNQVVVFSSVYFPRPIDTTATGVATPAICVDGSWQCGYSLNDVTKVTTIDVSTLSSPKVTAELYLPGSYLTARRIGSQIRLIINDSLAFPAGVTFWPQNLAPDATEAQRAEAFAQLELANEALIRSYSLDDWLRRPSYSEADGGTVQLGYNCTDFARSNGPTRMGIVTIATLSLDGQGLTSRTSVLEQADLVYASLSTLYIAAQHWWWWPAPGQQDATYIHAFDISQPNSASYLGSGVVNGDPLNQYSFDEWNGSLRVATQLSNRVADPANGPFGDVQTASQVSVLTLDGGTLVNTGNSPTVAPGDTLTASRFLGSRGFLVASRQVDPLITFDLSDPANPTKVAELQVSGFSSFLYPIDDTHLLAIGEQLATDESSELLQLTLFDVTDLTNPKVTSQVVVGQGYASSQALWDPKALTWFPTNKMLALPFVDWQPSANWTGFISDLRLFTVDTTLGISPAGSLSMADVYEATGDQEWAYYWSPLVTRSILADNAVYAISNAGIRSALVPNLPNWLATVQFPPLVPATGGPLPGP